MIAHPGQKKDTADERTTPEVSEQMESKEALPKILTDTTRVGAGFGAVVKQYKRCGKPNCRCAKANGDHQHGPYYYRVWRSGGKVHKEYLSADRAGEAKQRCDNRRASRRRFRHGMKECRRLWHEMNTLLREMEDGERRKRELLRWH